jgi:hypothetical protein
MAQLVEFPLKRHSKSSVRNPVAANTLTGRILTTTSPGGWTLEATSIQPPARLMSTAPHPAASSPIGAALPEGCRTCK